MTVEEVVRERLLDLPDVTALVGTRIYQQRLPQGGTLPAVRVQIISEPTDYHLRGGSGMYRARVQVDVFAHASADDPYADVTEIAAAIHGDDAGSGLSGWHGQAGGSPPAMRVHVARRVDRMVRFESEELQQVRCRQDYMVDWTRIT